MGYEPRPVETAGKEKESCNEEVEPWDQEDWIYKQWREEQIG